MVCHTFEYNSGGDVPRDLFFKKRNTATPYNGKEVEIWLLLHLGRMGQRLQRHQAKFVITLHQEAHLGPCCTPPHGRKKHATAARRGRQFDDGSHNVDSDRSRLIRLPADDVVGDNRLPSSPVCLQHRPLPLSSAKDSDSEQPRSSSCPDEPTGGSLAPRRTTAMLLGVSRLPGNLGVLPAICMKVIISIDRTLAFSTRLTSN